MYISYLVPFSLIFCFFSQGHISWPPTATLRYKKTVWSWRVFFLRNILIINFERSFEMFWYLTCTLYMWTCEGGDLEILWYLSCILYKWTCEGGDWEKRNFGVWGTRHWEAHGRNSSGIIWIFFLNIFKSMEGVVQEYFEYFCTPWGKPIWKDVPWTFISRYK